MFVKSSHIDTQSGERSRPRKHVHLRDVLYLYDKLDNGIVVALFALCKGEVYGRVVIQQVRLLFITVVESVRRNLTASPG